MFTRFASEFADLTASKAINGAMINLSLTAQLETSLGWKPVSELVAGDEVATLDGGFVPIAWVGNSEAAEDAFTVPEGALDNCSELILPGKTLIGMTAPLDFEAASDQISVPLAAFDGLRGIHKAPNTLCRARVIGFETEEMLWTQTGMLVHARAMTDGFFQSLSFAEARGLLALIDAGHYDVAA